MTTLGTFNYNGRHFDDLTPTEWLRVNPCSLTALAQLIAEGSPR